MTHWLMQADPGGTDPGILIVAEIVYFLIFAVLQFLIARKLGEDNPWFAFLPFLNIWLMVEMAGVDWWYILLLFLPGINILVYAYLWWEIADAAGKPPAVGLLCWIPCINIFGMAYLAFTD